MPKPITDPELLAQLEADDGPQPITDPALLAQLDAPEPTFGDKVMAFPGKVVDAVKGNAAEDAPDVYSKEFSQAIGGRGETGVQRTMTQLIPGANLVQLGMQMVDLMHPDTTAAKAQQAELERDMAAGAGKDEDVKQRLLRAGVGLTETQDANGNPMLAKGDKRFYVNKPGLDWNDTSRGIQKAAAFIPASRATSALGNVGARILGGALTAGATQGAMDLAASEGKRLDTKDVALAALFGGGAEAAAPVIGAVWKGLKNAFAGDPVSAGKALALKLNLGTDLGDDVYRGLAEHADEIAAGMKPEAALAEAEFKIPTTRGQKTGDFSQLSAEERIANEGGAAGNMMRGANQAQQEAVAAARNKLGVALPDSSASAMERVQGALRSEEQASKAAISDAYGAVDKSAMVGSAPLAELPGRLRKAISNSMSLDPATATGTMATLRDIEKETASLAGVKGIKIDALENMRRRINGNIGAAANPADKAALTKVKGEYDAWVGDTIDTALIRGDAKVLEQLKKARGLRADYARRFEGDEGGAALVAKVLHEDTTPDQVANLLLGSSQVSAGASASVAKAVKNAVGDNPEAWDALRGTVLLRATTDKAGNVLSATQMQSNLRQMLKERPDLMKTLFPQELPKIRRFTEALSTMVKPEGLKRSSGTGERIWNYVTSVPGLSWLKGPASIAQAHAATQPLGNQGVRLLAAPAGPQLREGQGSNQ